MVKKNTNAVEETAEKKVRRPRSTGKSAKPVDMPLYQRVLPPKKTKAAPAAEEQSAGEKPVRGKKNGRNKAEQKDGIQKREKPPGIPEAFHEGVFSGWTQ